MTVVKGGEFMMGDFGPLTGEHIPYSIQQDDKNYIKLYLAVLRFQSTK